jgi:hypothetical protein
MAALSKLETSARDRPVEIVQGATTAFRDCMTVAKQRSEITDEPLSIGKCARLQ